MLNGKKQLFIFLYLQLGGDALYYFNILLMTKLIPFVLILVFWSCKSDKDLTKIYEGIIEYDITYSSDSITSVPVQFLPKKMLLQFNQHYASYKIEDMMGVFCITNTTNVSRRTHISTIKIFNKKYKYVGKKGEVPVFFRPESVFLIKETEDTVTLAGIKCQKSAVTDLKARRKFDVAYSEDFFIKEPNINTPYSDINGILMKFEIDLGRMRLTLTAKKIVPSQIKNQVFRIGDDYKLINEEKMREIIATMLR